MMAEAYGKLTGAPGHLPRHARARHDERHVGAARRVPGLDADGDADRADRPRDGRPRGVPGGRLPPLPAAGLQVGDAGRPGRAAARAAAAGLLDGALGPPRARRARAARGHADGHRRACRTRRRAGAAQAHPGREQLAAAAHAARRVAAPARGRRRRHLDAAGGSRLPRVRRGEQRAGHGRRSAARTSSTTAPTSTSATRASASTRGSRERYREADLLLVAGARLGESTTSGYALVDIPVPQVPLVHAYPDPRSSAARTSRRCRS